MVSICIVIHNSHHVKYQWAQEDVVKLAHSGVGGAVVELAGSGVGGAVVELGGSGVVGAVVELGGSGVVGAVVKQGGSGVGGAVVELVGSGVRGGRSVGNMKSLLGVERSTSAFQRTAKRAVLIYIPAIIRYGMLVLYSLIQVLKLNIKISHVVTDGEWSAFQKENASLRRHGILHN